MKHHHEKASRQPSCELASDAHLPRDATDDEIRTLPHVVDRVPPAAWIASLVGACERFSYYIIISIWQNYMQHPRDSESVPGALGLGQWKATTISNSFFVFMYLTPTAFAVACDLWLGRFKTLVIALCLYISGALVMFTTSLPAALDRGVGIPGLAVAMVLIGLGVGGIKATISPFIGDQYAHKKPQLIRQADGALAIVDGPRTLQFLYNAFYWFTNIASLSAIPATFLEREFDFWTAYLMALIALIIGLVLLVVTGSKLVRITPSEKVLPKAIKAMTVAARHGFKLDSAKPSLRHEADPDHGLLWDDNFIDELRRGLIACRVIFSFSLFYLSITQMYNNLISQAAQMDLSGIPNDMIPSMAAVAAVLLGPIIQTLYNFLAQRQITFGPIARITFGFIVCGGGMAYAAGLQSLIYDTGPCYEQPRACPASDGGRVPNNVSVWVQLPVYVILAVAEIFGLVTASEYAYSKAPRGMRSIVQAMMQLSACIGALLGMAISPAAQDPHLVILYACLAGAMALCSGVFWWRFHGYDRVDDKLNNLTTGQE